MSFSYFEKISDIHWSMINEIMQFMFGSDCCKRNCTNTILSTGIACEKWQLQTLCEYVKILVYLIMNNEIFENSCFYTMSIYILQHKL